MMQLVALAPDTFSLGNSAHGISSLIPPFIQQTFVCKDSASQREKSSCGFAQIQDSVWVWTNIGICT